VCYPDIRIIYHIGYDIRIGKSERAREGAKMKEENHAPVSVYAMQPPSGTTGTTKRLAVSLVIRRGNIKLTY
jgi:hypothetical protein